MTQRRLAHPDRAAYLAASEVVDVKHPSIAALAERLRGADVIEGARACFTFVRDQVEHSVDFQRSPTTCVASEALAASTGFCYAKSHLLVALLRAQGLAAGFCYQRLTVDGPNPPYCLHCYVAVELPIHGWYAIDARGNKPGVDARFLPPHEQLAFATEHEGERDFPLIFAEPLSQVVACLRAHATWDAVLRNLPDAAQLSANAR